MNPPSSITETSPAPLPGTARLQGRGTAAADEVRKVVRAILSDLLGNFLSRLPAALTAAARSAATPAQQSGCLKLARTVAADAGQWKDTYIQQVEERMTGKVSAVSNNEDRSAAFSNDEVMSIANVELRAESLHQKLVIELDAQFERIRRTLDVPVYTKALAPAGLCRALQDTADLLNVPAKQLPLLVAQFDALVVNDLQQLYRALLDALGRINVSAITAPPPEPEPPTELDITIPRRPQVKPVVKPNPGIDPKTVSMLQAQASSANGDSYSDGSLAADLLSLSSNEPLAGVSQEQAWVPLQRMKLAGEFLNQSVADPFIPEELGPQHESVRFPLVKSALTDSTLFTAITHPLRSLVNELLLKSATSRITGSAETRRMAELLQQVLVQFDLAPDFVREAMLTAQPLPEEHIKKFFEMQRQQAQERRETVINQAKRMVIQELEQYTFGRGIPEPALKFLNTAWGPLLVKRLLMHGAEHALRKEGLALMEQLLDQLDERDPTQPADAAWLDLMRLLGEKLAADGLVPQRVSDALAHLEIARRTPR